MTGLVGGEGMPEQRILLVEDDEDVGEVLKIALVEEGYMVDFAATAAEAWRHLAAHRYALVLSDWRLPDGDGSVIASLQLQGSGAARALWLPAGTLRVKGDTYCAALKGMAFEPCFNLTRIDDRTFRGAVSGLGFAYCDFTRRASVAGMPSPHMHGSAPASIGSATAVVGRSE